MAAAAGVDAFGGGGAVDIACDELPLVVFPPGTISFAGLLAGMAGPAGEGTAGGAGGAGGTGGAAGVVGPTGVAGLGDVAFPIGSA